jgi:hypothetical protein
MSKCHASWASTLFALLALGAACSGGSDAVLEDAGPGSDAQVAAPDAGSSAPDAARVDASSGDGGVEAPDAGPAVDAGTPDTGTSASRIVLFGSSLQEASTWVFDGSRWQELSTARVGNPGTRIDPQLFSLGGQLFLHGGSGGGRNCGGSTELDDTWAFDGAQWTLVQGARACTSFAPAARLGDRVLFAGGAPFNRMRAFDGARFSELPVEAPWIGVGKRMAALGDTLVLFGGDPIGIMGGADPGATWVFDGARWTELDIPGPAPRANHTMATLGDQVVLFGGVAGGRYFGDTWVFDGERWREIATPGPEPRARAAMAALDGRLILHGGQDISTVGVCRSDTWAFDGARWEPLVDAGGPQNRCAHAMATLE